MMSGLNLHKKDMKKNLRTCYVIASLSLFSLLMGILSMFGHNEIPEHIILFAIPLFIALFYFEFMLNDKFKLRISSKKCYYIRRVFICMVIFLFAFLRYHKSELHPEHAIMLLLIGYSLLVLSDSIDAIRRLKH